MQVTDTANGKARKKKWSAAGRPLRKEKLLEEEGIDRPVWKTRCASGYGPAR